MRNEQFLARWPTGRGNGYIAYSRGLKQALASMGPVSLAEYPFEVLPVSVANTGSLDDGSAEVWSTSGGLAGPMFLSVHIVFDSEAEVVACINNILQGAIDSKLRKVEGIHREIEALNARKID